MLEIDAEPGVRALSRDLHIHLFGGEAARPPEGYASRYDATIRGVEWPRRVALVPLDPEPARAWRAEIEALSESGDVIASTTLRGGYAEMRTALVSVRLDDACIGVPCEGTRCDEGACVDPAIDVDAAPDLAE
jgi:hypothetical protein